MSDVEQRLADLERRMSALEGLGRQGISQPGTVAASHKLLAVEIRNKRADPQDTSHGKYEDHILFDCYYTLSSASKRTRAVKGVLEFADLFGEVIFRLNATLNFALEPGKTVAQEGVGFTFNEFLPEHQWMLATDIKDMVVNIRVLSAIYADGTSENFI
jgi:hypothetical protein